MYAGLKHSSCSQFINEKGGTVDELQMLTDHARRDSVLKYADVELERKRELMGRVLVMKTARRKTMIFKLLKFIGYFPRYMGSIPMHFRHFIRKFR